MADNVFVVLVSVPEVPVSVPEARMVDNVLVVASLDRRGRSDVHTGALPLRTSPRQLQTSRRNSL